MSARGWGLFALVSLLWGVPYLINSIALDYLGPLQIVAGRVVVAGLVLGPVLALRGRWRVFGTHGWKLIGIAMVEIVIPFSLISIGQQTVPSGTTGVIIALEPLFIALLAPTVIGSASLCPVGWCGLALGMAGVVALLGLEMGGGGILLIVLATVSYAYGAMLMGKWFSDVDSITASTAMILAAAPLLVLVALLVEPFGAPPMRGVVAVVILGVFCTAWGFIAFFALIKQAGAARAAFITHAAPIVSLIAGVIVLGESVTGRQLLGCVLILVGAGLVMYTKPRAVESDVPRATASSR